MCASSVPSSLLIEICDRKYLSGKFRSKPVSLVTALFQSLTYKERLNFDVCVGRAQYRSLALPGISGVHGDLNVFPYIGETTAIPLKCVL